MDKATTLTLDFPFLTTEGPACLEEKATFSSSIVLQGCFLSSWRLFKYMVLMCASKLSLESIPPPLCFFSDMGFCQCTHSIPT